MPYVCGVLVDFHFIFEIQNIFRIIRTFYEPTTFKQKNYVHLSDQIRLKEQKLQGTQECI